MYFKDDELDESTESILVIGGNEGMETPVILHLDNDTTKMERCGEGKHRSRMYGVGEFLNQDLVRCSGKDSKSYVRFRDCLVIGRRGSRTFTALQRSSPAAVKLNESTLWITGGYITGTGHTNLTEFVDLNGTRLGPSLPMTIALHCMVRVNDSITLIISGEQNGTSSGKTWIVNTDNEFQILEGPSLYKSRTYPSCGVVLDSFNNTIVVVAGGQREESVEFLNTTTMENWTKG